MTEHYWQKYRDDYYRDPFNTNELWVRTQKDLDRRKEPKHHLELYSICKTMNPYIQQIKNSPNITINTVAELICRDKGCELMYCQLMQKKQAENRRSKMDLKGCKQQYSEMNRCINQEIMRIKSKEEELRNRVFNKQQEKPQQQTIQETPLKENKLEEKKIVMINK